MARCENMPFFLTLLIYALRPMQLGENTITRALQQTKKKTKIGPKRWVHTLWRNLAYLSMFCHLVPFCGNGESWLTPKTKKYLKSLFYSVCYFKKHLVFPNWLNKKNTFSPLLDNTCLDKWADSNQHTPNHTTLTFAPKIAGNHYKKLAKIILVQSH